MKLMAIDWMLVGHPNSITQMKHFDFCRRTGCRCNNQVQGDDFFPYFSILFILYLGGEGR